MDEIAQGRAAKDHLFGHGHESPLTPEQRASFTGLRYFAPDPAYRFLVRLEPAPGATTQEIQLSDGATREMDAAGALAFTLGGQEQRLVAYESESSGLFVPFRDATSGQETYGAGRYVEAHPDGHGTFLLDFNAAYNPYCAYNDAWSCPLPPRENWLSVPIKAGEQTFPHD
ncbi:MAG TPA: DUF1684 domain-containing protein [Candidatus Saccharimonadales bacterium]|nr:DUF1684 domain-containing protein [Candidatus Saccharimonadales bacterium]